MPNTPRRSGCLHNGLQEPHDLPILSLLMILGTWWSIHALACALVHVPHVYGACFVLALADMLVGFTMMPLSVNLKIRQAPLVPNGWSFHFLRQANHHTRFSI